MKIPSKTTLAAAPCAKGDLCDMGGAPEDFTRHSARTPACVYEIETVEGSDRTGSGWAISFRCVPCDEVLLTYSRVPLQVDGAWFRPMTVAAAKQRQDALHMQLLRLGAAGDRLRLHIEAHDA